MHVALRLRANCAKLEPHLPCSNSVAQLYQTLHTDILQRVLEASDEIGYELGDGAIRS